MTWAARFRGFLGWGIFCAVLMFSIPMVWAQSSVTFSHSRLEFVTSDQRHHVFSVEMAQSSEQLAQGLMFRQRMAADAGMLFDFGRVQPVSMWMKNTLIPLDMVFVDATGRVVGLAERTVPQSLEVISSPGPVRAVVELNGGVASRLGIRAGDRVIHPMFAAVP